MNDPITAPFAASLRHLRNVRAWSQRDLAARSGVSIATISTIERELHGPGLRAAILLARAFGVGMDDMVNGLTRGSDATPKNWSRCDP